MTELARRIAQVRVAPRRMAMFWLTLAAACWGIGTALSKQAVAEMPPVTVLAMQLTVSVALLSLVRWFQRERYDRPSGSAWLARLGILNPGLAYALSLLGLATITVSLSVLLWALEPLLILGLAGWLLRERIGPGLLGLSGVAIGGMLLVVVDATTGGQALGIGLTVAGVACCATYTVAMRRWLPQATSTLGVVAAQQAYALAFAAVLLVVVGLLGGRVWPVGVSLVGLVSVAASGILYYGLAYVCYLTGLRRVPASFAATVFYLIPVFGIAAGTLLGERLAPQQWVGAAIVIGAVALIAIHLVRSPAGAAAGAGSIAPAPIEAR